MHFVRNVAYGCLLSQSAFYEVLNVVDDGMFKRMFKRRNDIS